MSGPTVLAEHRGPGVMIVTLNRPHRKNALTDGMLEELEALCRQLAQDDSVRALVLTGADGSFCAGFDLDGMEGMTSLPPLRLQRRVERQAAAVSALYELPQAVIAAVDGPCVGAGLSLALAADIRVAASRARCRAAFVRVGLSGGDLGASWLLPRIVGLGPALDLLLSGRTVDADEAFSLKLVNRVVPCDALVAEALALAADIAANSPIAVAVTKSVVHANAGASSLAEALKRESASQVITAKSADVEEAMAAFREGRPPRFTER
ncbi:enoyl-CoA hydratase/isomerase family protein [Streptomyces vinaceus]|uniref:Enoyl-CoA hydratase/isomerase family protein n=1 Tax=Streptomyces vinaceus TaxID=1960 RepID=A0A5J6JFH2_STRVI|nr:enoyl-CoA hydratase-related protein [Streptomyces vinaceus]QEV48491.1 enoyl-CoA hydratase/isomerase family protein [Streptomyces vinaceus]GHE74529.1 putative enoyl-CoA hydratase/isomerase [Streptomyces vinaceus]